MQFNIIIIVIDSNFLFRSEEKNEKPSRWAEIINDFEICEIETENSYFGTFVINEKACFFVILF